MPQPSSAPRMFHLSLNVSDLERSIAFYRVLFDRSPARHEVDYAKFEIADPPLVLALEPRATAGGGALNHVGIRVADRGEVDRMQQRLVAAGLEAQTIERIACCYSTQTKVCTFDPDRTLWEVYVLDDQAAQVDGAARPIANPAPAPVVATFAHQLGDPFPRVAECGAASADEAHLRGTLNAAMDAADEARVLATALAALRPGGRLVLHMMVGDRPVSRPLPRLPGPAARVARVPVAADVLRAVEQAGFVGLTCVRYSHSPVYRFAGVEMRELMLTAWKRDVEGATDGGAIVAYKGPFGSVTDEDGVVYRRGEHVRIDARSFAALHASALAEHFVFVTTDAGCGADGCAPSP